MMPMSKRLLIVLAALLLAACDMLGLGPDPRIAQKEAEAKAIGGGCRHGLRSIEDCYTLNKASTKRLFSTAGEKWMPTCVRTRLRVPSPHFLCHRPSPQRRH